MNERKNGRDEPPVIIWNNVPKLIANEEKFALGFESKDSKMERPMIENTATNVKINQTWLRTVGTLLAELRIMLRLRKRAK